MKPLPIILLHGALGSKDQMGKIGELISSYPTFSFNFEGHGGRVSSRPYSIQTFSANISSFMEEHKLDQAHFFGYSMGGYVALKFALDHPEKVGKIMTLATKFDWNPESAAQEVKMLNPEKILEKIPHFAKALEDRHAPLDWKEVLHRTGKMMLDLGSGKGLSAEDLSNIPTQVLISRGSEDRMVSETESKGAVNTLQNAQFLSIEGGKHPIERVDANVLAEQILAFFNE